MTVEVKFTNVRLSTLLLKLRGRGWPAAGGGVAHVGVEVWWITVVETHTLCLYIHTRSLPSWLKNTVVLSKIQDIHVWCVGSTTVSGEMSMWQFSPGSSCLVCLSSSSYSNFMKATCPCWSLKQIQFHLMFFWSKDQADRLKKEKKKQTQKQAKNKQASLQPTVHCISTWRSCSCMSIAFSRLFLLSRLMVTWLPWTSRRFCLSTSSSLLREKGLVVAGSGHIGWELTWSCLFSPRRALFGKQDLSKTGWRCNKGESCCCDMLRYVIIIKHEICRIFIILVSVTWSWLSLARHWCAWSPTCQPSPPGAPGSGKQVGAEKFSWFLPSVDGHGLTPDPSGGDTRGWSKQDLQWLDPMIQDSGRQV